MKTMSESEIVAAFFKSGALVNKAIHEGNHTLNNREMRKMCKLYKQISVSHRDLFVNKCIPIMLRDGNYPVKIQSCIYLFDMQIYEKEAEQILLEIAKDTKAGLFAHQAELILHSRGIKL